MAETLGIIAGRGTLPLEIAETCQKEGRPFVIIGFKDQCDETLFKPYPYVIMPFGPFGQTVDYLLQNKIQTLVMAGKFQRPHLLSLKTDMRTATFFAKIIFKALGDDGFLRAITKALEDYGLKVVGVQSILKTSLATEGLLADKKPSKKDLIDIKKGMEVAGFLGRADVGQSVIVQNGVVLGLEAIEGTDKLIGRIIPLKLEAKGGVLIKRKKPNQDKRLDLPTIGPETVLKAAEANLAGIAIEAGGTLLTQKEKMIAEANRLGLFILGVKP